jgi:hypothetical protein
MKVFTLGRAFLATNHNHTGQVREAVKKIEKLTVPLFASALKVICFLIDVFKIEFISKKYL